MGYKISITICWIITTIMFFNTNKQIQKIECMACQFEQSSQVLLIDSLYIEVAYLGHQLDSMMIKYD